MKSIRFPCFSYPKGDSFVPNEYDMMWPANLRQVLGSRLWIWPFPITEEMKGQGFYYPKIPEITMSDLNILLKDASKVHNTSFTINDFEHDPRDYILKSVQKYEGNTFIIYGGADGNEEQEIYVPKKGDPDGKNLLEEIDQN